MARRFDDKVVLITGAGHGIGAEAARCLHREGARLVLIDLDEGAVTALVREFGKSAMGAKADVCDLSTMQAAVDDAIERFGGIDFVVANAGISGFGSVRAVDPAAFKRVVDVNLVGVFHTVRAALPAVIERQGYFLIVSSEAAFLAAPGASAYSASKAGVEHFANALRLEVAHLGVGVGSAHMSWIDTPLLRDLKGDLASFRKLLDALPYPFGKTIGVEECVHAFVDGLVRRRDRVYVPWWGRLLAWLKPIANSRLGSTPMRRHASWLVPMMDRESAELGRSISARVAALQDGPAGSSCAGVHQRNRTSRC